MPTRPCSGWPKPRPARPTRQSLTPTRRPSNRSARRRRRPTSAPPATRRTCGRRRFGARSWPTWPRRSNWPTSTRRPPQPAPWFSTRKCCPPARTSCCCTWPPPSNSTAITRVLKRPAHRFSEKFAASTLMPAVQFRHAENAVFLAQAVENKPTPNVAARTREVAKLYDEAIKCYTALIQRYPEAAHVQLARHGLAMTYYRKGDLDNARKDPGSDPGGRPRRGAGGGFLSIGRHLAASGAGPRRRRRRCGQAGGEAQRGRRPPGGVPRRGRRDAPRRPTCCSSSATAISSWASCSPSRPNGRRPLPPPAPVTRSCCRSIPGTRPPHRPLSRGPSSLASPTTSTAPLTS